MEAITADLIAMARAGKPIEETEPVALAAVATEAWAHVQTSDGDVDRQVPAEVNVETDRDRLLQIVENLFPKKVDHNSATVQIGVAAVERFGESAGTLAEFSFEDEGPSSTHWNPLPSNESQILIMSSKQLSMHSVKPTGKSTHVT